MKIKNDNHDKDDDNDNDNDIEVIEFFRGITLYIKCQSLTSAIVVHFAVGKHAGSR